MVELETQDDAEQLRKELIAAQEMLGFVLLTIGEPVVVSKESLVKGIPKGAAIVIDDDIAGDRFIFRVEVEDGQ